MAVCVRFATRTMEPAQVAFVRFLGSFVLLLVLSRGQGLRPRAESHARLTARAVLGTLAITLYFVGIGWAGAGLATLLHSTHPVWTAFFSVLFMSERFTPRIALALAANALGAAAVVGTELGVGTKVGLGCMAALTGGMLAGGSVATASALRRTESATLITVYFMGIGSVILAPSCWRGRQRGRRHSWWISSPSSSRRRRDSGSSTTGSASRAPSPAASRPRRAS